MSSSSTPPSTSTASAATSTQTSSTGSTTDATLYLYTFLATLVLLLAVSSAIVIRSLMLRRRHQRLVEEAIRTGTWLPHPATTRRRRDFGQKPTLWEARVAHDGDSDGLGDCEMYAKSRWVDIRPVYAAYVHPHTSPSPPQAHAQTALGAAVHRDPGISPIRFAWPFTRRRSPPSTQPAIESLPSSSPSLVLPPPPMTTTNARTVRVGVLIAMPHSSLAHAHEENGPPVVEIGVTEAIVTDDRPQNDGC